LPQGLTGAPFELNGTLGDAILTANGQIPGAAEGFAADVSLSTPNLDTLLILADAEAGITLPLELTARVSGADTILRAEDFSLALGQSDLAGSLAFDSGRAKPYVQGELRSTLLNVEELSGKAGEETAITEAEQTDELVLPDDPVVPVDLLRSLDADVTLLADRIILDDTFSTDQSEIRVALSNGLLTFSVPSTKPAGGEGAATLTISAQEETPTVSLLTTLNHIDYGPLLDSLEITDGITGTMDLEADLNGQGHSIHELAASANGFWKAIALDGKVDKNLLGFFAFGAGDLLTSFFDDGGKDDLNCFISAFDVDDGVGKIRVQVLDTSRFNVAGDGSIDFRDETLDFTFSPSSSLPSLLSFSAPFDVSGKWIDPSVAPSAAGTLLQIGKIAGSIVNPLVGLGILAADTALANLDLCEAALKVAEGDAPSESGQDGQEPTFESGADR
jgi:uncharacterized protein involved in outer membrane biogenesis